MAEQDNLIISPENKIKINATMQKMFDDGASDAVIKEVRSRMLKAYGVPATPQQKAVKEYEKSLEPELAADAKRPLGPGKGGGFVNAVRGTAADFFPNTYESVMSQDDIKRNAGALLADITSPGRVVASLPSFIKQEAKNTARGWSNILRADEHFVPVGESSLDVLSRGMRDTEGTHPVGKVVRSSALGGALLAAIPTFGTSIPATIGTIGLSALAGASMEQNKNYIKHKYIDPVQFTKDIAYGVAGGGLGAGAGKLIGMGANKATKVGASFLAGRRANKLVEAIKPSEKEIAAGVNKATLKKLNITDDNAEAALQRANKIYDDNVTNMNKIVEAEFKTPRHQEYLKYQVAKGKPSEYDPAYSMKPIIDKQRKAMTPGFKQEQKLALDDIQGRIKELTKGRKLKATDIENAKDIINKVSSKHPEAEGLFKGVTQELDDKFVKSYSKVITPDKRKLIKESYDIVQQVRPIKNALENTVQRGSKVEEMVPVMKTLDKLLSKGNLTREFVSSLVLPSAGVSSAAIVGDDVATALAPKIMNSTRKTILKDKYGTFAKKGPNISELDNLYKRFETDPETITKFRNNMYQGKVPPNITDKQADVIEQIIGRKFNVIERNGKPIRDITMTTNEEKLVYDLLLGKQLTKESAKTYKILGTMGNIAGQTAIADSGLTKAGRGIKGAAKTTLLSLSNMK